MINPTLGLQSQWPRHADSSPPSPPASTPNPQGLTPFLGSGSTPRGDYGRHLLALREAVGLTQQQLADKLGVRVSNIAFGERAAKPPRGDVLPALAQAFNVSMDELMRTAPPKPKPAPKGRLHEAFEAAAKLPRRQQQKIAEVVEALLKAS